MAYANTEDLATYLGVAEGALPADAERLLDRASELIQEAMLNNYDATDADHVTAAQQATCAQVERWIESGETEAISGEARSVRLGRFQVDNGSGSSGRASGDVLASRARRHLFLAGLLYRGVPTR